jgi:hypothetical protein
MVFRSHHVPQGIIKLKKKEFEDVKQGSMTVIEYVTRFTQISRYAPNDVDTDEKKQDYFLNNLNDGLMLQKHVTLRISRQWWTRSLF